MSVDTSFWHSNFYNYRVSHVLMHLRFPFRMTQDFENHQRYNYHNEILKLGIHIATTIQNCQISIWMVQRKSFMLGSIFPYIFQLFKILIFTISKFTQKYLSNGNIEIWNLIVRIKSCGCYKIDAQNCTQTSTITS